MVATRSGARKKAPEVEVAASTLAAPPKRATKRKATDEVPTEAIKPAKAIKKEPAAKKATASKPASKPASKAKAGPVATKTTTTRRANARTEVEPKQTASDAPVGIAETAAGKTEHPTPEEPVKKATRGRKPAAKQAPVLEPVAAAPAEPAKKTTRGRKPATQADPALEPIVAAPEVKKATRGRKAAAQPAPAPEPVVATSTRGRAAAKTAIAPADSTLKAPARKLAVARKPRVTKSTAKTEASSKKDEVAPPVVEEPFTEFPNWPTTPAHIKAPISNDAAMVELAGYPTTPAQFLNAHNNKTAFDQMPEEYPKTPAHVIAAYDNKQAFDQMPEEYPKTPAHVIAAFDNKKAFEQMPEEYPKTPNDDIAAYDNKRAFDQMAEEYPKTPNHVIAAYDNKKAFDQMVEEYPKTPKHVIAAYEDQKVLNDLPGYPETPHHIITAYENKKAFDQMAEEYPKTPNHVIAAHENQQALNELPDYPKTPHHVIAAYENMKAEEQKAEQEQKAEEQKVEAQKAEEQKKVEEQKAEEIPVTPVLASASFNMEAHEEVPKASLKSPAVKFPTFREVFGVSPDPSDDKSMEEFSDLDFPVLDKGLPAVSFAPSLPAPAPASPTKSALRSPQKVSFQTPKKVVTWQEESADDIATEDAFLRGMTFFVDVTSKGRDQSFIFSTLLEDFGAKVVPNYDQHTYVTHVLFKEGNMSTLELVASSNNKVKCVNVGWILESEKNKKRMDETPYLVDLSVVNPEPKKRPYTPAKTPTRFLLAMEEKSSSVKALPTTPTSSEFDRSTFIDDKENSELGIYFQKDLAKTAPRPTASWYRSLSPMKTPSKQGVLSQQPIKAFSTAKKRSATESFEMFSAPPKKLRFV